MTQAHIFISGFVQGVGFRHFIKAKANEFNIKGWVRNLPDNKVEAVLQGSKENVEKVIKLCKNGPFLSEVEGIDFSWEEEEEKFTSFDIL